MNLQSSAKDKQGTKKKKKKYQGTIQNNGLWEHTGRSPNSA